jgi:hypothetical protein
MDGQPVNFVTHAHGQGYADLNPIIPELVESLDYWKGPFTGEIGDLSTAGAAKFNFYDVLPKGIATLGVGQHNYFHALLADGIDLSESSTAKDRRGLTYAFEYSSYDGLWQQPGNSERSMDFSNTSKSLARISSVSPPWATTVAGIRPIKSRSGQSRVD